jgi:GH43 family beta-xylosidase
MNLMESNPHMKIKSALSLLAAASLALSSAAFAADAKTYEVTGPVLEVNDSMIAVQKGKDRWEVKRDANTKVTGDVKVGDKVHITYTMSATDVEVKAGKGGAKKDKKDAAKAAPTP